MDDVRVPRRLPVEHGAHYAEQGAARGRSATLPLVTWKRPAFTARRRSRCANGVMAASATSWRTRGG